MKIIQKVKCAVTLNAKFQRWEMGAIQFAPPPVSPPPPPPGRQKEIKPLKPVTIKRHK